MHLRPRRLKIRELVLFLQLLERQLAFAVPGYQHRDAGCRVGVALDRAAHTSSISTPNSPVQFYLAWRRGKTNSPSQRNPSAHMLGQPDGDETPWPLVRELHHFAEAVHSCQRGLQ